MAHPVDQEISKRLKSLRISRGLSQTELAKHIGVTFQQVQKYENGRNRITPGRLFDAAQALDVPITFFYTDESLVPTKESATTPTNEEKHMGELLQTARLLYGISDVQDRRRTR